MSEKQGLICGAMLDVMADIASTGIRKLLRSKEGGGFNYRGIEDAMNSLSPLLVKHRIVVLSQYIDAQTEMIERDGGKWTRFARVTCVIQFIHADDGSKLGGRYYGEAADTYDKAMTKAQSVAFRTALFQSFVVPTLPVDIEEDGGGEEEVEALIEEAKQTTTDADALAFWKARKAGLSEAAADALKTFLVQHRRNLAAAAKGAA